MKNISIGQNETLGNASKFMVEYQNELREVNEAWYWTGIMTGVSWTLMVCFFIVVVILYRLYKSQKQ